jgi:predicted 2-oxoglutarate/Fe(II)-dependent dioxygenase YbiX
MVIILTMQFLHSIDNLLSPEECEKYINYFSDSERVEHINDTHRKYNRVQFIDKELAEILYEKIKNYIPKKIKKISVGLNSYFRLSKYEPGQFFGIHKDGINFDVENKQNMSYATLNIFLNDDFEGGSTIFYENDKKTTTLICKPLAGRGSFFYSQQFHEGEKISSGYKYLLRTDLMINHNKK